MLLYLRPYWPSLADARDLDLIYLARLSHKPAGLMMASKTRGCAYLGEHSSPILVQEMPTPQPLAVGPIGIPDGHYTRWTATTTSARSGT